MQSDSDPEGSIPSAQLPVGGYSIPLPPQVTADDSITRLSVVSAGTNPQQPSEDDFLLDEFLGGHGKAAKQPRRISVHPPQTHTHRVQASGMGMMRQSSTMSQHSVRTVTKSEFSAVHRNGSIAPSMRGGRAPSIAGGSSKYSEGRGPVMRGVSNAYQRSSSSSSDEDESAEAKRKRLQKMVDRKKKVARVRAAAGGASVASKSSSSDKLISLHHSAYGPELSEKSLDSSTMHSSITQSLYLHEGFTQRELEEIKAFEEEVDQEQRYEQERARLGFFDKWTTPYQRAAALKSSSLFIFGSHNRFRALLFNISQHEFFEGFIILNIIANSIVMAFTDPLNPNQPYEDALDVYFTVVFSLEMFLKVISLGWAMHKGAYLRSYWNVLDFVIVVLSYVNFVPGVANLTALRSIRVLRPLRSMNAVGGIRMIVLGLLKSITGLANVLTLLFLLFLIFSIIGVQLWMGKYRYHCVNIEAWYGNDTTVEVEIGSNCKPGNLPGTSAWGYGCAADEACLDTGNQYANMFNFDSVPQAFLTLFSVMTYEGWPFMVENVYDTWGQVSYIYFFIFVLISSYFIPNLALAVINDTFVEVHNKILAEKEQEMEEAEQKALDAAAASATNPLHSATAVSDTLLVADHEEGEGSVLMENDLDADMLEPALTPLESVKEAIVNIQHWVFSHVEGYEKPSNPSLDLPEVVMTPYSYIMIVCIVLNTILLATQHHNQPDWVTDMQTIGNNIFTGIFAFDFTVRLFAFGFRLYIKEFINWVDAGVTIASIIESTLSGSSVAVVFRSFRLFRLFKLFRNFKSLRKIIRILVTSMKETAFLSIVVLLYMYMATLVGMQLFGKEWESIPREERASFETFFKSFITVFQLMTFDQWDVIAVHAATLYSPVSVIYFIVCLLIGNYLILQLYLAILIGAFEEDDFSDLLEEEEAKALANEEDFAHLFYRTRSFQALQFKTRIATGRIEIHAPVQIDNHRLSVEEDFEDDIWTRGRGGKKIFALTAPMARNIRRAKLLRMRKDRLDTNDWKSNLSTDVTDKELAFSVEGAAMQLIELPILRVNDDDSDPEFYKQAHSSGLIPHSPSSFTPRQMSFGLQATQTIAPPPPPPPPRNSNDAYLSSDGESADIPDTICDICGQTMLKPLPTAPLVPKRGVKELHQRMCSAMALRANKLRMLDTLTEFIENHTAINSQPELANLDELLSQAWSWGLMLQVVPSELVGPTWERCAQAIADERCVLNLCCGEELIGRSLVSVVIGSVHIQPVLTNGGYSLFLLGPRNWLRVQLTTLIQNPWFDRFIHLCILVSSLALAFDTPRTNSQAKKDTLHWIDLVFTSIFGIEMLLKIVAYGLFLHEGTYVRDLWNVMDAAIVGASIASLSITSVNVGFLRVLRVFRALRPLRLITKNRGIQAVVLTLFKSAKGILNVVFVALLNYFIFAVFGMQLFSGKIFHCNDSEITYRLNCTGSFDDRGTIRDRIWTTADRNFDNIANSLLALFEVSSMEYWTPVLWDVVDHVDHDHAPVVDNNITYAIYFIIFITIASHVLLNMFVGVMISSFNAIKAQLDGISMLTEDQRLWGEAQSVLLNYKPVPLMRAGRSWISKRVYTFVSHPSFELFITVCVIVNIVVLSLDHYQPVGHMDEILIYTNDVFSGIFILEVILKLTAMEHRFFFDHWNCMDFFLILISITNFSLRGTTAVNVSVFQVLRVFRIFRIMRLVKRAKKIRVLIDALWYSLPSIANVGGLMLVLMFLYSVIGVQLFYNIDEGEMINNKYANFFDFWNAFQFMFRFITVTDWNAVMHDCMRRPPFCQDDDADIGDCGTEAAPLYFVSYIILAPFVLMNLVVAIILDNFTTTSNIEKSQVQMRDIQLFIDVWSTLDPDAGMTIDASKFLFMLAKLRPPLGTSHVTQRRVDALKICKQFDIPCHDNKIHFFETLIPMARTTLGVKMTRRAVKAQEQVWRDLMPELSRLPVLRLHDGEVATVAMYAAAVMIQTAFRARNARRIAASLRADKKQGMLYKMPTSPSPMSHTAVNAAPETYMVDYPANNTPFTPIAVPQHTSRSLMKDHGFEMQLKHSLMAANLGRGTSPLASGIWSDAARSPTDSGVVLVKSSPRNESTEGGQEPASALRQIGSRRASAFGRRPQFNDDGIVVLGDVITENNPSVVEDQHPNSLQTSFR